LPAPVGITASVSFPAQDARDHVCLTVAQGVDAEDLAQRALQCGGQPARA
jgi:hypothetical protein